MSVQKAIWVDDTALTVPVTREVQRVINEWAVDHGNDLNERLAPFGLGNYDLVQVEFMRVVRPDEIANG